MNPAGQAEQKFFTDSWLQNHKEECRRSFKTVLR